MEIYFQEMNYTLNLLFLLNNQVWAWATDK